MLAPLLLLFASLSAVAASEKCPPNAAYKQLRAQGYTGAFAGQNSKQYSKYEKIIGIP